MDSYFAHFFEDWTINENTYFLMGIFVVAHIFGNRSQVFRDNFENNFGVNIGDKTLPLAHLDGDIRRISYFW